MSQEAVIYVRVSSKEQEREGYSIPSQKKHCIEYANKKGFKVLKVFAEAETAKQAGRAEFRKMLVYLDEHPSCQNIIVEKPDRLYRNFGDKLTLQDLSGDLKLHFFKTGQILSKNSKASDKLHHDIDVAFSTFFSNNLSEEVIKGHTEKVEQGGWPGEAPLGYRNRLEDRTIQINPDVAPLIIKTFELAATGQYSLRSLADQMYKLGLRSKRAKNKISHSRVATMLKNPFYYGYFNWKGVLYKGSYEPIITKELYDRVQEKMSGVCRPSSSKVNLTYTGSMICSHCGCAITGEVKRKPSGKTYIYYHCTNGKRVCDNVKYLREEKVEETVKAALRKIKLPIDVIEWTREKLMAESLIEQNVRAKKEKQLTTRLAELNHRKSHAYDHYLDGTIDLEMWEIKSKKWSEEMTSIQQELDTIELNHDAFIKRGIYLMELARKASSLFDELTPDEKREMVSLVLSNPRIENGSMQYDYKKPFSMFVNVVDLANWRGGRDSNPRPPA